MKELPLIDGVTLDRLLPMPDAIEILETTFAAQPTAPPARQHMDVGNGELLLMPAWSESGTGVKLVSVAPGNPSLGLPLIHGLYVLFSPDTLMPVALFDGAGLTRLRTAAVSGVATKYLARPDASRLVVFGAGVQAEAHVHAMRCIRPLGQVTIVSRTRATAKALAQRVDASVGDASAVAAADIVCTCTTSSTPVFDGSLLAPGVHVNAVGAYKPEARELDDVAISAGPVVVESRSSALTEAGDLVIPIASGVLSEDAVEELSSIIGKEGWHSPDDVTIFKSVGVAFEDLAVAAAAYERWAA